MWISNFKSAVLAVLSSALISGYHTLNYSDLEALGVNCPERDKCEGYRNNLTYVDRSCECDSKCSEYKDCCIDAFTANRISPPPRTAARTDVKCIHYGLDKHTGVYAVSKCSSGWTGDRKIREKCMGPDDFSDPLAATPVTKVVPRGTNTESVTYRNLYCAECNNANTASLTTFQLRVECDGLQDLTDEQIMGDLTHNERLGSWGVNRLNKFGNATEFIACEIAFDVPEYLNNSVRFCRSNIISKCAPYWTRPTVTRLCSQYMAVVYENNAAYKNPHCAICNHKTVDEISCMTTVTGRKRPMSFALLLDVNQSDGDQVGMRRVPTPECPSGHKYDPFFKKCRQLVCALPGHVVVNGRCQRG